MARAIRSVTVERGLDPREMALMAFGGGGALHAADVAQLLGIRKIVVPTMSGVFCSVGMLASDVEHAMVRAALGPIDGWRGCALAGPLSRLREDMTDRLRQEGFSDDRVELRFSADLRYLEQSSELTIPIDPKQIVAHGGTALRDPFQQAYKAIYGYTDETPVELVNLRVTGLGLRDQKLDFTQLSGARYQAGQEHRSERNVCFETAGEWHACPVLSRDVIHDGGVEGPAVLVSYDTTIAVPPDVAVTTDGCGSVVLDLSALIEGTAQ
jgi:N-methylhydantoinase A